MRKSKKVKCNKITISKTLITKWFLNFLLELFPSLLQSLLIWRLGRQRPIEQTGLYFSLLAKKWGGKITNGVTVCKLNVLAHLLVPYLARHASLIKKILPPILIQISLIYCSHSCGNLSRDFNEADDVISVSSQNIADDINEVNEHTFNTIRTVERPMYHRYQTCTAAFIQVFLWYSWLYLINAWFPDCQ